MTNKADAKPPFPSSADQTQFGRAYRRLVPALRNCRHNVQRLLQQALSKLGNPHLVRGRLDRPRVKTLESTVKKCERLGLDPTRILEISDLVGFRVVCANIEDITRFVTLAKQLERLKVIRVQQKRTSDGYRGVHIDTRHEVSAGTDTVSIPCEIQVRTLFQDSWARQTHRDLYKGTRVPRRIRTLSKSLSDLLAAGDSIAQQIREEMSQRRSRTGKVPVKVTEYGLGLIYQRAFGEEPPDYVLQFARRKCEQYGVERLDALDRWLMEPKHRARLGEAYRKASGFRMPGYEAQVIFELAPVGFRKGMDAAVRAAKKRGAGEQADLQRSARGELLSDLPDSFDGFMQVFESDDKDDDPAERIQRYASAFGTTAGCSRCNTLMVSEYDFAGELQRHYRVRNKDDEILQALWSSGIECGDGLCSYCGHMWSQD